MPKPSVDYSLYLVTGRHVMPPGRDAFKCLEDAILGGVTLVQIREKDVNTREFLEVARRSKEVCDKYNVPMLINDRVDIALAVNASGVHVGQEDMDLPLARRLLGPDAIIGVSVHSVEQARQAVEQGADYVGVGPCYPTNSKTLIYECLGPRGVAEILEVLPHSVKAVTIGGIKRENAPRVLHGSVFIPGTAPSNSVVSTSSSLRAVDGLAIISDIVAASSVRDSASETASIVRAFKHRLAQAINTQSVFSIAPSLSYKEGYVAKAAKCLAEVKKGKALIHQITNTVVQNGSANVTLALGASPIMSSLAAEAADLSPVLGALLINLGTLGADQIEAMRVAGRLANMNRKPIVFDPVGAGATQVRKETTKALLNHWQATVIKGNAGELGSLVGSAEVQSRGVDSAGSGFTDPVHVVRNLARRERCIVALTGAEDYISDGYRVAKLSNGHAFLGSITGSGCATGSAIACFAAAEKEGELEGALVDGDMFAAAIGGVLSICIAAEIAAARPDVKGSGTFLSALIDELYNLTPEDLLQRAKVEIFT